MNDPADNKAICYTCFHRKYPDKPNYWYAKLGDLKNKVLQGRHAQTGNLQASHHTQNIISIKSGPEDEPGNIFRVAVGFPKQDKFISEKSNKKKFIIIYLAFTLLALAMILIMKYNVMLRGPTQNIMKGIEAGSVLLQKQASEEKKALVTSLYQTERVDDYRYGLDVRFLLIKSMSSVASDEIVKPEDEGGDDDKE